jgi:hypothetical protein
MNKILLLSALSVLFVLSAPSTAHAFLNDAEALSYAAMPLAVADVCDVRGVQTDQVATLVTYMNRANVSPDAFIDVFRYVPVALVLHSDGRPDFVEWVGSEVDRGVMGDELITVMERRLTTYGSVVTVSPFHRHRYPRVDYAAYEPYYVPVAVRRYCEHELLDPFALIDMPVAVADVVELGVPIDRVGRLVVQLNLGYVSPLQTVEILRYSPAALLAVDYGGPDFVQYVYDQRVGGLSGFGLVRVVDRHLPVYGVAPQIDLASPVYPAQNVYVDPIDPAFVPPTVRTRVASFAAPAAIAATPQVQRLLDRQGNAVVMSPAQAHRELAQSMRSRDRTAPMAGGGPAVATVPGIGWQRQTQVVTHHPLRTSESGPSRIATAAPVAGPRQQVTHQHGRPQFVQGTFASQPSRIATTAAPIAGPRQQVIHQHGRPQFVSQPVSQPVMAMPQPAAHGGGKGDHEHGRGHGGGPPAPMASAAPAAVPAPAQAAAPAPAPKGGRGNEHGKGHKKGEGQ